MLPKFLRGAQIGNKTFKVHLDGYNLMPFLKGGVKKSPRNEFVYWNDDGQLVALRYKDWKAVFLEQNHDGIGVWQGQFTDLRLPKLFNSRSDPVRARRPVDSIQQMDRRSSLRQVPMQALAAGWLESFKEFPPRQKPASFNLDDVMRKIEAAVKALTRENHSRCPLLAQSGHP